MTWHGPALKKNRPEERKYTLWLKNSTENAFLREKGITCLADHEIGEYEGDRAMLTVGVGVGHACREWGPKKGNTRLRLAREQGERLRK